MHATSIRGTEVPKQNFPTSSVAQTVQSVAESFALNKEQKTVYDIVAARFVNQNVAVKALQELMRLHNSQYIIRFLGPTGSSAKQIGGMTIHKGLGLSISLKPNGRSNRKA